MHGNNKFVFDEISLFREKFLGGNHGNSTNKIRSKNNSLTFGRSQLKMNSKIINRLERYKTVAKKPKREYGNPTFVSGQLSLIGYFLLIGLILVIPFPAVAKTVDNYGVLDAGLIEWGDGYLKAVEGFELIYDGKRIYGEEMYIDTEEDFSLLNSIHFTGCDYDKPHYLIHAKQLEIMPQERLIFTGVRLQYGTLTMPIPFPLVLIYQGGEYRFPQWLPEVIYSAEDGIGVKFNGEYYLSSNFKLSGFLALTSKSGILTELKGNYQVSDLNLRGNINYDTQWTGQGSVDWREGKLGFRGQYLWRFTDEKEKIQKVDLSYNLSTWQIFTYLHQQDDTSWIPAVEVKSDGELNGIKYSWLTGVTKVTEQDTQVSHPKVYTSNSFQDDYQMDQIAFGWKFSPAHVWVPEYGVAGSSQTDLWIKTTNSQGWNGKLGYGRSDRWGETLPSGWVDIPQEEYVLAEVGYGYRDERDEGWDLEIAGKYSLESEAFTQGDLVLTRALDCQEWRLDFDLIDVSAKIGFKLKY